MTNIMAFVKNHNGYVSPQATLFDNAFPARVGIAMADSLGSDGREVTRGNQKLFQAGRNFVMGTGAGDLIVETAKSLDRKTTDGPLKVAQSMLDFTQDYVNFQPGEALNFIVAGYEGETLQAYSVGANRILKPILSDSGFAAGGSGSEFVGKALGRDAQRGMAIDSNYLTLADLAVSFYDLGHAATKSAGVDDQLQYGFFIDRKAVVLMHPFVMVSQPPEAYSDEKGNYHAEKGKRNNDFYFQFAPKMHESWKMQRQYNMVASAVRDGVVSDRSMAFKELDAIAGMLSERRAELNRMIISYAQMHCGELSFF